MGYPLLRNNCGSTVLGALNTIGGHCCLEVDISGSSDFFLPSGERDGHPQYFVAFLVRVSVHVDYLTSLTLGYRLNSNLSFQSLPTPKLPLHIHPQPAFHF